MTVAMTLTANNAKSSGASQKGYKGTVYNILHDSKMLQNGTQ